MVSIYFSGDLTGAKFESRPRKTKKKFTVRLLLNTARKIASHGVILCV